MGDYTLGLTLNAQEAGHSVQGHAIWDKTVGLPDGGQAIDQTSINASTDASGTAHGTMTWTGPYQSLPGHGGPGDPWIINVDTLIVVGNRAYISGIVSQAGQHPVGLRVTFVVIDNGNGGSGPADEFAVSDPDQVGELNFVPSLGGNLKVR